MKIGFIGGGNMAEAMIKGMTSHGMKDIIVSEPKKERRQYLNKTYATATTGANREVVESAEIIILAVKPQNIDTVINEISSAVTENKTIVSIAAGIKLDYFTSKLNTKKIVRVMPNTPALVQEGMSVMSLCECFSDHAVSVVREILMSMGKVITLPEKYMDAVTAVSGSGPGFIAFFIESMIDSAVKMGLSEDCLKRDDNEERGYPYEREEIIGPDSYANQTCPCAQEDGPGHSLRVGESNGKECLKRSLSP